MRMYEHSHAQFTFFNHAVSEVSGRFNLHELYSNTIACYRYGADVLVGHLTVSPATSAYLLVRVLVRSAFGSSFQRLAFFGLIPTGVVWA